MHASHHPTPESGTSTGTAQSASRHLFFKGIAGLLLGCPIALWLSWLLMYTGLGPPIAPVRDQVAMWIVFPLWATVLSLSFLANSRLQCIAWLMAACAVTGGLWWVLQ